MAFPGANLLQILDQIRTIEPEPFAAETPEPLAAILRRLLIRDPDERTITMREVAEILFSATEGSIAPFFIDHSPMVV